MIPRRRTEFLENHYYFPDPGWTRGAYVVMRAGRVITAPGYCIERTDYPGQDVLFCQSGRGFVRSEEWSLALVPGQLAWLANEAPHAHWPDEVDPWTLLWLRLNGPNPVAVRRKIFGSGPTLATPSAMAPVEAWFDRLFAVLRTRDTGIDLALNHLLAEFFHLIAADGSKPDEARLPSALLEALAYMRRAPERAWPAERIAAASGLSAAHTRRLFRRHLGLSPHQWLIRERIMLSQKLLLETDASVGRVAELCGFCDLYHFSRQFKHRVGTGPRSWRQAEGGAGPVGRLR